MPTRTVTVDLGPRSYDVVVGAGVLAELGERLRSVVAARTILVAADDTLPLGLIERVGASLSGAGLGVSWVHVHASEREKSMATAQRLAEAAASARLERGDAFVALGGGVVGDLTGFAASIYRRGAAVIQCPTTLLSMVDASVGGKTGVNLVIADASGGAVDRLMKNMAGTFHQPRLVVADIGALATLPARHLRSGLAECIKHGMIAGDVGDGSLLAWLEQHAPALAAGHEPDLALIDLVARNVAIKAAVVAQDEFEVGSWRGASPADAGAPPHAGREALNLGHTFGHAFEAMEHLSPDGEPGDAPLHHGEAVALGLVAASATAETIGQIPAGSTERVRGLVASAGLPTRVAGLPDDDTVMAAMADDKKVRGGVVRLVLPWRELGRVRVAEAPARQAVAAGLAAIRAS